MENGNVNVQKNRQVLDITKTFIIHETRVNSAECEVLRGHYNYYGVPGNGRAMNAFRYHVGRLWFRTLCRRSQKTRINWERMKRIIKKWLPYPKIRHPYPEQRLCVFTRGRSPVR